MGYSAFLKPRQETISEEGIEGIIDLANLKDESRTKIEARPDDFFQLTYPTSDIKKVLDEINVRFSSSNKSSGLFLFEGLKGRFNDTYPFFKQWGGWGADGRLLFGKTWDNMPAPAQNIFHGINKTDHIDLKYTIPEERI
ncbi:MAG: phage Gp37/Gp68 family protein [Deltaproteobacteria bacterium]|jgi:hypothetical protein|nr:phage Gp37/Gp68 family protein [Deltaproteobacteria bacterium]